MAVSLTWGGVLSTPWFHLASRQVGRVHVAEVVFPHSTGRTPMVLGAAQSEGTSNQVVFAEEGELRNRLVAATDSEINAMEVAIQEKRLGASFLGTLRYVLSSGFDSGNLLNYELAEFELGPWERVISAQTDKAWQRTFRARFVKWH